MFGNEYIPDYNDLHREYEARRERELRKNPKCAECGERITDEYLFDIEGVLYCQTCMNNNFRKDVEDYI